MRVPGGEEDKATKGSLKGKVRAEPQMGQHSKIRVAFIQLVT